MKRIVSAAIAIFFLLLAFAQPVMADSPEPKYGFSSTIYDGQAITGRLIHAERTAKANVLEVRVTFFVTGNYYMATVGETDEEGRFEVEGVGPIEYITAVAIGSGPNGERTICGAVGFEIANGTGKAADTIPGPAKTPTPEPTERPTEAPTPAPTATPTDALTPTPTDAPAENPSPLPTQPIEYKYVLNTNTKKFHRPGCASIRDMLEENKAFSNATREEIILQGFDPCKRCKP